MDEWIELNEAIESDKYEYISFDVFDTLLMRPFWEPIDLFYILGGYAKSLNVVNNEQEFMDIRIRAEEKARSRLKRSLEDVSLEEIYEVLKEFFGCCDNIEDIMKHEMELELKYCYRRQSGYDLYCKAIKNNKKVICITDMYLSENMIKKLLVKNGFIQIEKIYVSSEIRLGKYTGKLYQHVIKDLGINSREKLLHIGDNYHSDVLMAKKNGLNACYFAKAKDLYLLKEGNDNIDVLDYRIEKAIEVNRKYDNPFRESNASLYLYNYRNILEDNHILNENRVIITTKGASLITKIINRINRILK